MGQVVSRNAGLERIMDSVTKSVTRANARGGQIQSLAVARLAATYSTILAVEQQLQQAHATNDLQHATLMARDAESDLEIGAVADEIWNTLGRTAQSVDYALIVGSKNAWTDGDPTKQHHLMAALANNIRRANNPKLADKQEAWATRIEQKAAAQADASAPVDDSDALVTTLTMQRKTLVLLAQVGLTRFKRDLKNLGMTEAQVHEIIPDVSSAAAPPSPAPQPAVNTPAAADTPAATDTQPTAGTKTKPAS